MTIKTKTIKTITFDTNEELIEVLNDIGTSGMATLESTTVPKHTVKSRETKTPFVEAFKGDVFTTKKDYVTVGINFANVVTKLLKKNGINQQFTPEDKGIYEKVNTYISRHKDYGTEYFVYYVGINANAEHSERIYHYETGEELSEEKVNDFEVNFLSGKSTKKVDPIAEELSKAITEDGVDFNLLTEIADNLDMDLDEATEKVISIIKSAVQYRMVKLDGISRLTLGGVTLIRNR